MAKKKPAPAPELGKVTPQNKPRQDDVALRRRSVVMGELVRGKKSAAQKPARKRKAGKKARARKRA